MNLTSAVQTVLRKYAVFSGRACRSELWYWVGAVFLLFFVLAILEGALLAPALGFEAFAPESGQPLRLLMSLVIFLPSLAVAVRRLHDIGRSGWWLLIQVVPIVGALILLWWYVQPGNEGPNQYG